MKSRISIALGEENQPVIKVDYKYSDDVRDHLVKRFIEGFYYGDKADVKFITGQINHVDGGIEHDKTLIITPIPLKP